MTTQPINLTETAIDGDVFTIEKAVGGNAIVLCNATRAIGAASGLPAGCGLISQLAEISLIAAGMTVLAGPAIQEMEIEMLSDRKWSSLKAVSEIVYSEEDFATGRCDIRHEETGSRTTLVARAVGTIFQAESPAPSGN